MSLFFFFNDTATTEIYTLSLHDALPISEDAVNLGGFCGVPSEKIHDQFRKDRRDHSDRQHVEHNSDEDESECRSEEHTSELQSPCNLVCRLLLEKKKDSEHTRHTRTAMT